MTGPHVEKRWTLPPVATSYIDCIFTDETPQVDDVADYLSKTVLPFGDSPLLQAEISSGRLLSCFVENRTKERIELTLEIEQPRDFLPGDSIGIFPTNPPEEVDELLSRMNLNPDVFVHVKVKDGSKKKLPTYLPLHTTPKYLLSYVLDIRGILKKAFLRSLAEFASGCESECLKELCSKEGSTKYNDEILLKQYTLCDLLRSNPSCRPPLQLLLEHLPRLLPRAYSIASSPLIRKNQIKIIFTVVTTTSGKPGVCSNWLKRKFEKMSDLSSRLQNLDLKDEAAVLSKNDQKIQIYFRKPTKFRCPDRSVPVLMIGPGSGIAPFRGFLEHFELSERDENVEKIDRYLYFGCRFPNEDEIYKKEIEGFLKRGILTKFCVCFSRCLADSDNCRYVQDLVYQDMDEVFVLIENPKSIIFLCGDAAHMAKDVDAVFSKILAEKSGISKDDAFLKLKELEGSGRYLKDVWR